MPLSVSTRIKMRQWVIVYIRSSHHLSYFCFRVLNYVAESGLNAIPIFFSSYDSVVDLCR